MSDFQHKSDWILRKHCPVLSLEHGNGGGEQQHLKEQLKSVILQDRTPDIRSRRPEDQPFSEFLFRRSPPSRQIDRDHRQQLPDRPDPDITIPRVNLEIPEK